MACKPYRLSGVDCRLLLPLGLRGGGRYQVPKLYEKRLGKNLGHD